MAFYRSVSMNPISRSWYGMAAANNFKLAQALTRRADTSAVSSVRPVNRVSKNNVSALSKDSSEFLKKYQDHMAELQQAAQELSIQKANGVANQLTAASSDRGVAEVQAKGNPTSPASYQLDVQQVATAQTNQSSGVWAGAAPSERGTFTLETQEGTADLHIDPTAVKSNRELYQAMADEINRLDLGVTAKAQEANGKVSLTISSANTGKENGFTVSGTLAEKMGVNQVQEAAQDAVYSVKDQNNALDRGKEFTSASNQVSIGGNNIEATLKQKGSSQIKIGDNIEGMAEKLSNLVKTFNKTVKFLDSNAERGTGVLTQMRRMAQLPTGEKAMNMAGLSVNGDGTLSFDKDSFTKSMESSPSLTKEIISGNYGVARGIQRDAQAGMNTPSAKLVDSMKTTQNLINQMAQSNMLNQWSYSPMGAYSKASSYNLFNYFTSGAMMSMYI